MGLVGDDIPSKIKLTYETLWEKEYDHRKKGPFRMGDFSDQEGKFQTKSLGKGSPSEHFFDAKICIVLLTE